MLELIFIFLMMVLLSEMTFTSHSGTAACRPPEQNLIFGDMIQLSEKSPIPLEKFFHKI